MGIPAGLDHKQLSYLIHDMRSVTTSVALMVDLLELAAKAEDDSVQRARAISAQKSCEQLGVLCAEAAMLLTGSADAADSKPRKFSLLELLVEVSAVYSPIYDLAGKKLRMNATGRSPQFYGIRSQMFRAISNLLDNGLKHTLSGSIVDITCSDTGKEFAISISDDGPGFANLKSGKRRTIDSLPIVRKHVANSSEIFVPGTGLRYISETVSANGGTATVELNARGGTTFTLAFQKQVVG